MKVLFGLTTLTFLFACSPEVKKENRKLVEAIDYKVKNIDHHHRIKIVEDDLVSEDSRHKVRGYMSEGRIQKWIGIIRTPPFERDDYFYVENEKPIFSEHMINFMDESLAEGFQYYYRGRTIVESLFWEDHYDPNKRFPHEHFEEFEPDIDSLMNQKQSGLNFYLSKFSKEGFELKDENTNLNN